MPERKLIHKTIIDKGQFDPETFKTVPVSHVEDLKGKYPDDYQAIVGKLKKTGKWKAQKVLIPKKNPDNPKPKKGPLLTREQTITILLAIVGIIVSVVGLYLAWKASQKPPTNGNNDLPPQVIPGVPRLWHFDITPSTPSSQVSWYLPATAHVNSISGHIHLVNTTPGQSTLSVGVSFWVGTASGEFIRVGTLYPPGGMGSGFHPFSVGVSISEVTVFMVQIDRFYGLPWWSRGFRIDRFIGDALVVA